MLANLQPKTDKAYDEFKRLGLMTYNTDAALKYLSDNGVKVAGSSMDKVDASMRKFVATQTKTKEGSASFNKAYKEMTMQIGASQSAFYDSNGNIKSMSEIAGLLHAKLGGLTNAQRQMALYTMFGSDAIRAGTILFNEGAEGVNNMASAMDKITAKETAEEKLNNLKGAVEELSGAVETTKIEAIKKIAPQLQQFVEWVTSKVPAIGDVIVNTFDYISKHTDEIVMLAKGIGAVTVALIGLSAVGKIGNSITGIKELTGLFKGSKIAKETTTVAGGLKNLGIIGKALPLIFNPVGLAIAGAVAIGGTAVVAHNKLMKKSLSTTTEELGFTEKVMNKLTGSMYKSKKEMMDLGLIYDDFGDGVSDNFKTAARNASKSLLEIEMNINRLNKDGVINKAENNTLKKWVNDFTNEGINSIKQKQSEIRSEFEKAFTINGKIDGAGKEAIGYLEEYFKEGTDKQESLRDEIYKIGDDAIKRRGFLLDSEIASIKDKLAEISALKLEYADAESAGERGYAKSRFESKVSKTAEKVSGIKGASEILQERAKERDNNREETKARYDGSIKAAQQMMESSREKGRDEDVKKFEKVKNEAIKAKSKALKNIEEDYISDIKTIYKFFPKAEGKLNEYDGTVLSGGAKEAYDNLEKMKKEYPTLNNITESGYYGIKDSDGGLNAMYVSVSKTTGDIIGAWNATKEEVGAATTEIGKNVKELGNVHSNETGHAMRALVQMGAKFSESSNQIVDAYNAPIGILENIQEAADGTRAGILNLNGTPIQITTNADGAIISFSELNQAIEETPSNVNVNLTNNADQAKSKIDSHNNSVNNVPKEKSTIITTTIKTIYEKILSPIIPKSLLKVGQKATGTSFANGGLSTVDERGWELSDNKSVPILGSHGGNPLTYMSPGTKILNHMQSVQDMKKAVAKEVDSKTVKQPRQMQYQLIQTPPQQQVQVASLGGLGVGDINVSVSVNQNSNEDSIIAQVTHEVARYLKAALSNTKK